MHKLKKKQGRTEKVSKINVPPQAIAIVHNDKTQIQAKPQPQVVPAKADSAKPTLPAKSKTQTSTNTTLDARTVNAIPKRSRFISIHAKRTVFARSKGQCEFISSDVTRCKSRHRLHLDHIQPFAKNGSNEAENLRHLCAQHNQRAAIEQGLQQTSTRTGADFVKFMQNSPLAESSLEI